MNIFYEAVIFNQAYIMVFIHIHYSPNILLNFKNIDSKVLVTFITFNKEVKKEKSILNIIKDGIYVFDIGNIVDYDHFLHITLYHFDRNLTIFII